MFSWDDIRFFIELARSGTFELSSEKLNVDQSTVRRRIQALEAALKTKLFIRDGRSYAITDAGKYILSQAENMEKGAHSIFRNVGHHHIELTGEIRLTTEAILSSILLAEDISSFHEKYPDINLTVLTENRFLNLSAHEADIAIRLARPIKANLVARKLGRIAFSLYASKDYLTKKQLNPEEPDLINQDILNFDVTFEHRSHELPYETFYWADRHCVNSNVVFKCDCFHTLRAVAEAGGGLAMLPKFIASKSSNLLEINLPAESLGLDAWVLVHPDLRDLPVIKVLINHFAEAFERNKNILLGE